MKIEFENCSDTKEVFNFFNEIYGIDMFHKKYLDNPSRKVVPILTKYIQYFLFCLLLFIVFLALYLSDKSILCLIVTIFYGILVVLSFAVYISIKSILKRKVKEQVDKKNSAINVDKEKIIYSFNITDYSSKTTIPWDSIQYVLFNKHSIFFFSKTKDTSRFACSIDNKDKIIKMLDKFDKNDLIVDNTGGLK